MSVLSTVGMTHVHYMYRYIDIVVCVCVQCRFNTPSRVSWRFVSLHRERSNEKETAMNGFCHGLPYQQYRSVRVHIWIGHTKRYIVYMSLRPSRVSRGQKNAGRAYFDVNKESSFDKCIEANPINIRVVWFVPARRTCVSHKCMRSWLDYYCGIGSIDRGESGNSLWSYSHLRRVQQYWLQIGL